MTHLGSNLRCHLRLLTPGASAELRHLHQCCWLHQRPPRLQRSLPARQAQPEGAPRAGPRQRDKGECPNLLHSQRSPQEGWLGPRCGQISKAAVFFQTVLFSPRCCRRMSARAAAACGGVRSDWPRPLSHPGVWEALLLPNSSFPQSRRFSGTTVIPWSLLRLPDEPVPKHEH